MLWYAPLEVKGQATIEDAIDAARELSKELKDSQVYLHVYTPDWEPVLASLDPSTLMATPIHAAPPPPQPKATAAPGFKPDRPVETRKGDDLGRTAIADAIAKSVREVWDHHETKRRPFAVHLAGRWGSGKSSVLSFLKEALTSGKAIENGKEVTVEKWLVVDFNAWRRQDEGTPWWALMNAVVAGAKSDLPAIRGKHVSRGHRLWLWRRGTGFQWWPVAAILALIAVFVLIEQTTQPTPKERTPYLEVTTYTETLEDQTFPDGDEAFADNGQPPVIEGATSQRKVTVTNDQTGTVGSGSRSLWEEISTFAAVIVAFFGTLGSIYGVVKTVGRKQSDTADALLQLEPDATAPLQDRFQRVIKDIGRPVAIFVDDLDRCDASYVVELLETFQTIYADVPVLYVVAADRDWIVSAYGQVYKDFSPDISKPGQPLGHLFVEKIFQLSVSLPDLGNVDRDQLLDALLGDAEPQVPADDAIYISQIQDSAGDIDQLTSIVKAAKSAGAGPRVGQAAFAALQTDEAQEAIGHVLRDYTDVMDPNPRALKRLLNDYTYRQGFLLLAGEEVPSEPLIHWSILNQRFPYAASEIADDPDLLEKPNRTAWDKATKKSHTPYFAHEDIDTLTDGITKEHLERLTTLG